MFILQNNVAFKWHRLLMALSVWECANRLDSTNLKCEISTGRHISIGFFDVKAIKG